MYVCFLFECSEEMTPLEKKKFTAQAVCVCHIMENGWTSSVARREMKSYICIDTLNESTLTDL